MIVIENWLVTRKFSLSVGNCFACHWETDVTGKNGQSITNFVFHWEIVWSVTGKVVLHWDFFCQWEIVLLITGKLMSLEK